MRRRRVALLLLLAALGGCTAAESELIAVSRLPAAESTPGRVQLVFAHCRSGAKLGTDEITAIDVLGPEVIEPADDAHPFGEATRPVVWSIAADGSVPLRSVVIGEVPAGFVETVASAGPLPPTFEVELTSADPVGDESLGVHSASIPDGPDQVVTRNGRMSRSEFVDAAREQRCDEGEPWAGPDLTKVLMVLVGTGAAGLGILALLVRPRRAAEF